jgi:glycosyltransferase involved in cell wall biosynthesis
MMGEKKKKIVIVMPAYNAAKTLKATIESIGKGCAEEILLVDDASQDGTSALAKELGLKVMVHERNLGYGGNQKTCYASALKTEAEIIVMIHPDYQYDGRLIPSLILPIELNICDVMLGNRVRTRSETLQGGMPLYKYLANRFLTLLENFLLGQNLGEFHSGMRAYSRQVLETIPWKNNSDDFVFDQQFLIQSAFFKLRMGDIPISARYFPEASSINFVRSIKYGLQTLWTLALYFLAKSAVYKSKLFRQSSKF